MLDKENSLLLIIDMQEKLVAALDKDVVVKRTATLTQATKIFEIPVIATQQYSKGLGLTVEAISQKFSPDTKIFEKTAFSAFKEQGFADILKSYNKKQIVICGIETHICVHQTTQDLIEAGYEVYVVKDACASRNKYEFKQGIERMYQNGAKISCLEMVLFEWLKDAKAPEFREIQALVK